MRLLLLPALIALAGCHEDTEIEGQPPVQEDANQGRIDASPVDAALPDLSLPDAALPDAALPDAALPDATPPDAGCVEGTIEPCALAAECNGSRTCTGGVFGDCVAPEERCDGTDNDCDGTSDEGFADLGAPCSVGEGACASQGVGVCDPAGASVVCSAVEGAPAPEVCDGIDNNCDGVTDEANPQGGQACNTGAAGACAAGLTACADGALGCVPTLEARPETCDGIDNDCDGGTDEDDAGQPLSRACYDGPAGTAGVGRCVGGTQTCVGGVFGACLGQTVPEAERCDSVDDDCNGVVDDLAVGSCACQPNEVRDCYTGPDGTNNVGICRGGRQTCAADGTSFGPCQGEQRPGVEACDGTDNDCDGTVDDAEGTSVACTVGVGACQRAGTTICDVAAGAVVCDAAAGGAGAEVCDGIDNDCNGIVDDVVGLGDACNNGVGACLRAGSRVCDLASRQLVCNAVPAAPAAEACDGIDNNCNGATDEDANNAPLVRSCYDGPQGTSGVGRCLAGTQTCNGGAFGACQGQVLPAAEVCDNIDNNCNGATDDLAVGACACQPNEVRDCYTGPDGTAGVGICVGGRQTCLADGTAFGACVGERLPAAEACDGIDNDCDGTVDDAAGVGEACSAGVGECQRAGTRVCNVATGQVACNAMPGVPAAEICDGLDNDCNNAIDNVANVGAACANGVGECRRNGTQVCDVANRQLVCNAAPGVPAAEICDGLDNDCNNAIDNVANLGAACANGVGACRRNGTQVCDVANRQLVCNIMPGAPGAEACNNTDDDCDGRTDEQVSRACYGGPAGTAGVGLCRNGTQTCAAGAFGACAGEVRPAAEFCDMNDNDCDGAVDDIRPGFEVNNYAADFACTDAALGDINRDGRLDIICAPSLSAAVNPDTRLFYYLQNANGTFGAVRYTGAVAVAPFRAQSDIVAADLDADGDADVVAVGETMSVQVYLANNGALGNPATAFVFDAPGELGSGGLVVRDLTGDNVPDIAAMVGTLRDGAGWRLAVARGNGNGTFAAPVLVGNGSASVYSLFAGDVDADGDVDVLGVRTTEVVVWTRNGANFNAPVVVANVRESFGNDAHYRDLNGDGRADLALPGSGFATGLRAQGAAFAAPVVVNDNSTFRAFSSGDFDCDPGLELLAVRGNPVSPIRIWTDASDIAGASYEEGDLAGTTIEIADLNNDGLDDIVVGGAVGNGVTVLRQLP